MTTNNKVALVTGTSSGIGLHTAIGLALAGVDVVATMRDTSSAGSLEKAATEAGVQLDIRPLDVVDEAACVECVAAILADKGSLDILVNNAGQGRVGTLEQLSIADLRATLELNYVAVAALTRLVLPTMRKAGSGRIVSLSSVGGAVGQPFNDAYCGAKFAVEGLMQALAPVMAKFGVEVCIVEPGAVATGFVANVGFPTGVEGEDPYAGLFGAYIGRTSGVFDKAQSAKEAAAVVVEAATTTEHKFRWQTSEVAEATVGMSLADMDGSTVLSVTSTWLSAAPTEPLEARGLEA